VVWWVVAEARAAGEGTVVPDFVEWP